MRKFKNIMKKKDKDRDGCECVNGKCIWNFACRYCGKTVYEGEDCFEDFVCDDPSCIIRDSVAKSKLKTN